MQTIVFFSNDGIQVLQGTMTGGRLIIEHFKTLPVEAGSLINGVITNEDAIRQTLSEAMAENSNLLRNVKLVIESSLIAVKNVEVPKLKPKELAALAATEFEDTAGNYEDMVVDYSNIPGPNGINMFCCGVEKRVIEAYVTLLESLKIRILSIDVGLNAIIQYVTGTKDYHGMTLALNILDGKDMLSILFENGLYIFSTRSRLMADRGTDAFADELSAKLSSLIQFNKSQKSEYSLNMSLYAGLDEDELNALKNLVFDPDLSVFIIPQTPNIKDSFNIDEIFDFGTFIYPIAGFFTGTKAINLYSAYKKSLVVKKERHFENKALVLPIGMLVALALVFAVFFVLQINAQHRLSDANAYINDENNQQQYLQAQQLSDAVDQLNSQVSDIETINKAVASNPNLGTDKLTHLATLCNSVITLDSMTYDNANGCLSIAATASSVQEAAHFVERLKATGYFTQVEYGGYSQMTSASSTSTTTTTGTTAAGTSTVTGYSFAVEAYLKAGDQQ
ncbi:hypothetical protein GH808_08360 [Acetobacterium fimetarium]|uniref:Type IV pilus assembly protein PilM n=1 Tax=Acetobacterium fimetarium TaxID=52691 RepID=A0ABR6WVA8_9FIRM|nr:hypothetical protein [Acetobacterium fimetarium]MBC3804443.1 hypothetical protein [Acetobacterium fimetarium]